MPPKQITHCITGRSLFGSKYGPNAICRSATANPRESTSRKKERLKLNNRVLLLFCFSLSISCYHHEGKLTTKKQPLYHIASTPNECTHTLDDGNHDDDDDVDDDADDDDDEEEEKHFFLSNKKTVSSLARALGHTVVACQYIYDVSTYDCKTTANATDSMIL